MDNKQLEKIQQHVSSWLEKTSFKAKNLEPLSGGTVNFTYLVDLEQPLDDGSQQVVVKHGEKFVRHTPEFEVSLARVSNEFECIRSLSTSVIALDHANQGTKFSVTTPRGIHLHKEAGMQIHEFITNGIDLRTYLMNPGSSASLPERKDDYIQLGKTLGKWTRDFHDDTARQKQLSNLLKKDSDAQQIKQLINYQFALDRVDQFRDVLGDVKDILEEIKDMAAKELQGSSLKVIHGDFNPANVLIPDSPLESASRVPLFVIDWEMVHLGIPQLDTGQMLAELHRLWLCYKIEAGIWITEGFCDGYGSISEEDVFRTAIHAGVQILAIGAIDKKLKEDQVMGVVMAGKQILVAGYEQDKAKIEKAGYGFLFNCVE